MLDEADERDYQTPPPWRTKKQVKSPESPETGPRNEEEDVEMQELLAVGGTPGSNGDGGGDDGDGSHNGGGNQEVNMGGRDGEKRDYSEFRLVNQRNIIITTFTGRNPNINPYVAFNNAMRRLMLVQGTRW